jgi:hypothetical protein
MKEKKKEKIFREKNMAKKLRWEYESGECVWGPLKNIPQME